MRIASHGVEHKPLVEALFLAHLMIAEHNSPVDPGFFHKPRKLNRVKLLIF